MFEIFCRCVIVLLIALDVSLIYLFPFPVRGPTRQTQSHVVFFFASAAAKIDSTVLDDPPLHGRCGEPFDKNVA